MKSQTPSNSSQSLRSGRIGYFIQALFHTDKSPLALAASLLRPLALVGLLMLMAQSASAQLSITAIAQDKANASSLNLTITSTGSNRIMIVGIAMLPTNPNTGTASTVSSVTWTAPSSSAQSFTRIDTRQHATQNVRIEMWGLLAPNTGTNGTITITLSAATGFTAGAFHFTGGIQSLPTSYVQYTEGDASTSIATLADFAVADQDVIIDIVGRNDSSNADPELPVRTDDDPGVLDGWDQKLSVQSNKIGGASSTYRYTCTPGPICTASGHSYSITGGGNGWAYGAIRLRDVLGPTLARLNDFSATRLANGRVALNWDTGYEVDNLGFNIYREQNGTRALVNRHLVAGSALTAGAGVPMTAGKSYSWVDKSSPAEDAVYWLEDVDLDGESTWHGPFTQTVERSSDDELLPRLQLSQTISDLGSESAEDRTVAVEPKARLPRTAAAKTGSPAPQAAVKIAVKQTGWHRVTQPELVAAGLSSKINPRLLQLYVDGRQQSITVSGEEDNRFDTTDAVEFYGVGLDSPSSDTRVYWLTVGPQMGMRMGRSSASQGLTGRDSFSHTVERRDRTVYFPSLLNGEAENFFGAAVSSTPVDQAITLRNIKLSASENATLEVALQGVTSLPHSVRVLINGFEIQTLNFEGRAVGVARLDVPHSMLKEGANTVNLQSQGGASDVSLVSYIRLTYEHTLRADDDALSLTVGGGQQVTVAGFSKEQVRVIDVTDPANPTPVAAAVSQGQDGYAVTASVSGAGRRTILALTQDRVRTAASVRADQSSSLKSKSQAADFVIISHRDFISSLQPLAALRQRQGLSVTIVDVEDIYDEFSYGQKSTASIRSFLSYTRSGWRKSPRFALLVGDASFDPRNYLGAGSSDLVPTKLIETAFLETASDDWFADFNDDGLAEMALGRLPAKTAQEAALMVSKIVSYDASQPSQEATLVADRNDGFNFERASDSIRALMPQGISVNQVYRSRTDDAAAKTSLIAAITRGQKVVNYAGHGSVATWRGGLFTAADAASLSNSNRLTVLVTMTCLNGYFHDPAVDSLAEGMVKSEGGAVAAWASSGLTSPNGQWMMDYEVLSHLFTATTIGEATQKAKAAIDDGDIRRSWILLGDPTMKLR